ncbi:MAG: hypothetical protein A2265_05230, partial [Bacteroidetes bacterium RIFOXYA12_FULL_33_9]
LKSILMTPKNILISFISFTYYFYTFSVLKTLLKRKYLFVKYIILFVFVFIAISTNAQIGGKHTYSFLNVNSSARIASLGGNNISIYDNDLNFAAQNPSLLSDSMHNHFAINYLDYFTDINLGSIAYARKIKNCGSFSLGLTYMNYGEFIEADETGKILGDFTAKDYVFNIIWAKKIDSLFSVGAELKPILSNYESYSSFGMAVDLGATYFNPKNNLSVGLVLNNIGVQLKPYTSGNKESLPFEIQAGISKKLKHAPFRVSLTFHNLETYDLTYVNTNEEDEYTTLSGDTISENKFSNFADDLMRHAIVGIEFLPTKNFYIQLAYNYQHRQEMKLSSRSFIVGMTWGFGIKVSKFRFSYSKVYHHLAGAPNYFSITTNLSDFYNK